MASSAAYHKRNLGWPLSRHGSGFRQMTLVARFDAALRHLALTPRGSYYSDSEYGTSLYKLRTQSMSEDLLQAATAEVQRAVATYVPDIVVTDVQGVRDDDANKLSVNIFWTIRAASQQLHGELAKQNVSSVRL